MLKLTIAVSLLIVTQAANLDNILSKTWTLVAIYPVGTYIPVCVHYNFNKLPSDGKCICTDEKATELVEYTYADIRRKESLQYPVMGIDSPTEVVLDVNCTCDLHDYTARAAIRSVNENYIVMYNKDSANEAVPYSVAVFAKEVSRNVDITDELKDIEELKNKQFTVMCASEVNNMNKNS